MPQRKYCDITGLPAKYTHPRNQLRYASAVEYSLVNNLSEDMVQAYLKIRNAQVQIK